MRERAPRELKHVNHNYSLEQRVVDEITKRSNIHRIPASQVVNAALKEFLGLA